MVFEIKNKVALVTGGASGIGLAHVKELLTLGAQGVVLADINEENSEKVSKDLNNEFGAGKVIFVKTNVADYNSFEDAFKIALKHFNCVDILINNAGIAADSQWEKQIDINLKGTINGVILGLETYLRHHKQGEEAVILNTASIAALQKLPTMPIYATTKFGIIGLTKFWGNSFHFERTNVRVLGICPGKTTTPLFDNIEEGVLNLEYNQKYQSPLHEKCPVQCCDFVAKETMRIIEKAPVGSVWIIEDFQPAYEYQFPERSNFNNNILP